MSRSTGSTELRAEPRTGWAHRADTETKTAFKTTELWVYLLSVVGVLIASQVVGTEEGQNDYFTAERAWLYIALLTIGYMISRGLAKSGSREPHDHQ